MSYEPLVSIVIPVYKGEPYLRDAIDSCLNQTYKNIEIIVVNDGSPDNGKTESIAKSYGDLIRYFYKENGGVSSALNYGIAKMRGEWFSWLSHDDLYEPDKIKKQIEAVSNSVDRVCVVRCSTVSIDEKGKTLFRPQRQISGTYTALEMMRMHSLNEVGLYGCALLIHKKILDQCGKFDEQLRVIQDEDYWARIMFSGFHFLSIPDALVKIRIHSGQATVALSDRFAPERMVFCNKILDYYKMDEEKNFELLYIFILKQAKEHRDESKKQVLAKIGKNKRLTFLKHIKITIYSIYGIIYSCVKCVYKKVFIRRSSS